MGWVVKNGFELAALGDFGAPPLLSALIGLAGPAPWFRKGFALAASRFRKGLVADMFRLACVLIVSVLVTDSAPS